jgi:hypothetical protein
MWNGTVVEGKGHFRLSVHRVSGPRKQGLVCAERNQGETLPGPRAHSLLSVNLEVISKRHCLQETTG